MAEHHSAATTTDRHTDDPQWGVVALVGVVSVILLYAIILAAQAIYLAADRQQVREKIYNAPAREYQNLRSQQLVEIDGDLPTWISEPEGQVQLPIQQAMRLFVAEHGSAGSSNAASAD